MLIACKCLNITLNSTANNLPVAASISNYDDNTFKTNASNANSVHTVSTPAPVNQRTTSNSSGGGVGGRDHDNHDDQPPFVQCSTAEHLDSDQLQFFRTVNMYTFWLKWCNINQLLSWGPKLAMKLWIFCAPARDRQRERDNVCEMRYNNCKMWCLSECFNIYNNLLVTRCSSSDVMMQSYPILSVFGLPFFFHSIHSISLVIVKYIKKRTHKLNVL